MKKIFYTLCIIAVALTLQSCPGNEPQDVNNERFGCAYILPLKDTVQVKYSDVKEYPHTDILYSSDYPTQITWYPEQNDSIPHSADLHELQVQKLTNYSEVIVIESSKLYINDELWSLQSFTDPADTIQEVVNAQGQTQTIILHKKIAPYNLNEVIEQLELNYPDYVHRITDTESHSFNNWEVTMDRTLIPKIYLTENE